MLDVGLHLFVTRGFHGTATRDIARAAEISPGLMFHYFPNKEALYEALLNQALRGMQMLFSDADKLATAAQSAHSDELPAAYHALLRIARVTLDSFASERDAAKLFLLIKQASTADFLTSSMQDTMAQMDIIERIAPLIAQDQATGLIRAGDPVALSLFFFASLQGIAESVAAYPQFPLPEAAWFVRYLLPDPSPTETGCTS